MPRYNIDSETKMTAALASVTMFGYVFMIAECAMSLFNPIPFIIFSLYTLGMFAGIVTLPITLVMKPSIRNVFSTILFIQFIPVLLLTLFFPPAGLALAIIGPPLSIAITYYKWDAITHFFSLIKSKLGLDSDCGKDISSQSSDAPSLPFLNHYTNNMEIKVEAEASDLPKNTTPAHQEKTTFINDSISKNPSSMTPS